MCGNLSPLCSASRYGSKRAFSGSSSVIALKMNSVLDGYKLLINCADCSISAAVTGQRGWATIRLSDAALGAYEVWSVDMMAMF